MILYSLFVISVALFVSEHARAFVCTTLATLRRGRYRGEGGVSQVVLTMLKSGFYSNVTGKKTEATSTGYLSRKFD